MTLGEDLPNEMARVRDVIIPRYESIGVGGIFALAMMRQALDGAARAMADGDTVAMIHWYQALKDFTD